MPIRKISNKLSTPLEMGWVAKKKTDYKKLCRHIVDLNQKKSSVEIIRQGAQCLKEVINCRFFAFAIKKDSMVDVWLDPLTCRESLEKRILKDFDLPDKNRLNYLNPRLDDSGHTFSLKNLISYGTNRENLKIYIIPENDMSSYHEDMVDLILQSCSSAISRQKKIESLSNAAAIDPLTGCYNRREFDNQLKKNMSGAMRHKTDLSIIMFDLDHFKKVNDVYGHLAGDEVLKNIASIVKNDMREGDIVGRFGGEEFIAILPGASKFKAMELAERLRIKISDRATQYNNDKIHVTASFGVAQFDHECMDISKIIKNADDMLYKAKVKGRNMVMPGLIKIVSPLIQPRMKHAGTL